MKSIKPLLNVYHIRFLSLLLSAFLLVSMVSCDDDDDNDDGDDNTLVELAQGNANLSSLEAALVKFPDLVSTLSGTTSYTVFAPTDEAFEEFLAIIGQDNLDDIPEDVLRTVLEYHVIAGEVSSNELTNGNVTTVGGETISVNVSSGVTLNTSVNVTTADVAASNGIVHIIDAVLVPPSVLPIVGTVVAPAYFNKDFSTLVAAVSQAGLLSTLISPSANYTLFAPTNDAFAAAGIDALPPNTTEGNELLSAILLYHVLGEEVNSSSLPTSAANAPVAIETLGGDFFLTNRGSGVFINGTTEVVGVDIPATNGIVHIIDRTLVPPDMTIADIAIAYSESATPEFTQLVAALAAVPSLLEAADDASASLTVFAPTDAAFNNLYEDLEVADLDELIDLIGIEGLTQVLQHHIVSGRVFSTDLVGGNIPTLNSDNLSLNLSQLTLTDGSGSTPPANLVPSLLNVHANNGVIHVIDKVLVPDL